MLVRVVCKVVILEVFIRCFLRLLIFVLEGYGREVINILCRYKVLEFEEFIKIIWFFLFFIYIKREIL